MKKSSLGFGKLFNVLQSSIGRVAFQLMRNIEIFPSKLMYLYFSLVERKVAEFYHDINRRLYLVLLNRLLFSPCSGENSWCLCLLIFKDLTLIALNSQDRFAPGDVYKMNYTFFVMRKGIRVRF